MKKLFKNSFMALAVLALGFSACTEEVEYTPAEMPSNDQVYFPNTTGGKLDIAKETKSFDVTVSRVVTGNSAVVPVTVEADEQALAWFEFPESVEFVDTMTTATYTVTVKDGVEFEYDKYAQISLSIAPEYATAYGNATCTFQVGVPAPWSEWKETKGVFNFSLYVSGSYAIPVYYREHMLDKTKAQYLLGFTAIGANEDVLVDINKETGACQVGVHYFLDNSNYGPVYLSDMPNYPLTEGLTYEDYPCTYDAEYGLFSFNLIYFVSEALGSSGSGYFAKGVETLQLDGFEAPEVPDYSFAMEYRGTYIDMKGVNNAVISTTKGVDVAKYLMTVISADEDANAAVQGMLKGEVACDTLTEAGFYAYPMTESGNFKALAITFDVDGNPLEAFAKDFEFYIAGQENPWKSLGYALYTDDIVAPLFEGTECLTYQVEVLENKETPGLYRIMNPYGAAFPYNEEGGYDTSKDYFIEIDATDPEAVWIPGIYDTGCNWGYGNFSVSSFAYNYVAGGYTLEEVKDAGYCGVLADNVITFPVKTLMVSMAEYKDGQFMYANKNGMFKLDMSNMTEAPAASAARSAAARVSLERNIVDAEVAVSKIVTHFKKIDNSFLTPMEFEF